MYEIRKATIDHLDFLVRADLAGEGYAETPTKFTADEVLAHKDKISVFVNDDLHYGAWICEDLTICEPIGMILCRFRKWPPERTKEFPSDVVFYLLDKSVFPIDGRFCEVFQLWVDARYRRQGLGSQLKLQLEIESNHRDIQMIYTHTEEQNTHVLELNRRLGYTEIRRGPIWDDTIRVSLVKYCGSKCSQKF